MLSSCSNVNGGTNEPDIPGIDIEKIIETLEVEAFVEQLKLGWQNEHSYLHEVRLTGAGHSVDEAVYTRTESSAMLIAGLEPDQSYEIQMRVHDSSEWTDWSGPISTKTALFSTKVSTYNVLSAQYDHQFPGNTWRDRKLAVLDIIKQADHDPDILTVQELMDPLQANELAELLAPVYDGYLSDKNVSARGIFWKNEKYSLVDSDDVDILGDEIPGYYTTRVVSYVRLLHIASGKELMVFNIHLPWGHNADAQRARHRGADNLSDIIMELSATADELYTVIPGDYNNYPETVIAGWPSSPQTFSENGFRDAFEAALDVQNGDYGTTNDILEAEARIGRGGSMRVDYIFAYTPERIAVSNYKTIINLAGHSDTEMQQPVPSDHHPVRATFHFSYP